MRVTGWVLLFALGCSSTTATPDDAAASPDSESDAAGDAGGDSDSSTDSSIADTSTADTSTADAAASDSGRDGGPQDAGAQDGGPRDAGMDMGPDTSGDAGPPTAAGCFEAQFVNDATRLGPDYDSIPGVRIGSHCNGTDHQDISGIERVVFIGDSITVGSPPTLSNDFYRVELAERLAVRFGLEREEGVLNGFRWEQWANANPVSGMSVVETAGDFASCAEWGARADDLQRDGSQLEDCFPPSARSQRNLVILTVGGNDLNNLTQAAIDGAMPDELWAQTREYVDLVREAVAWLKDPVRFPAGTDVVLANVYEFTDGTGDVGACDTAVITGFDGDAMVGDTLREVVVWANLQYMDIAVTTGSDMIFLLETFCGHGYRRDDPEGPCYRGPGQDIYFDLTCIHPNPRGHGVISDLFFSVVAE
ncbi:MAG: SGNH/GDSL hydrolase family protein [Polyangiales bacterium]